MFYGGFVLTQNQKSLLTVRLVLYLWCAFELGYQHYGSFLSICSSFHSSIPCPAPHYYHCGGECYNQITNG